MRQAVKSMDFAILNLIEVLEREGKLKLSPRRYAPTKITPKRYLPHELLPTPAAATILHVKVKTLANWRVSGRGPKFVKTGGLITYRYSDLQSFIASKVRGSTSEYAEDR